MKRMDEIRREQAREIAEMKRHPGYWWNYLILKAFSKGWIAPDLINRIGWRKKK